MPDIDNSVWQEELLATFSQVELNEYVIELAWSPNGSRLAAATVGWSVFLVNSSADSVEPELIGQHAGGANSLSWRHDGSEFATAGHDGLVKIWNGNTGKELCALEAGNEWVSKVVYNPRRNVLASGAGKHLKLWSAQRKAVYQSSHHL